MFTSTYWQKSEIYRSHFRRNDSGDSACPPPGKITVPACFWINCDILRNVGAERGIFAVKEEMTKKEYHTDFCSWGPVIIYRLVGAGGGRILGGSLDFRRTKGMISRNWEPKRGDHWKLWKDSKGGPLKFAWKMKAWGGSRKPSKVIIWGDHFRSEVTFNGGIG